MFTNETYIFQRTPTSSQPNFRTRTPALLHSRTLVLPHFGTPAPLDSRTPGLLYSRTPIAGAGNSDVENDDAGSDNAGSDNAGSSDGGR